MLVDSLHIEGLRTGDGQRAEDLGSLARLPDGPVGIAGLDALELLAASCDPDRTAPVLAQLGVVADPEHVQVLSEDGLPVQARCEGHDAAALIDPRAGRTVRIRVDLALDPPLFGRLREQALRDPRLVNALGEASLSVRLGWIWTRDLSTISIGLLGIAVGDVAFPTTGADRPAWLAELLREVGGRILRVPEATPEAVAALLHEASLSPDPAVRERYHRVVRALHEPPFSLGELELVRVHDQVVPCFGPALLRARHLGPAAAEALPLVTAVLLDQPDVLLVERPGACQRDPEAVERWLEDCTAGDDAVLEQVILARGGPA